MFMVSTLIVIAITLIIYVSKEIISAAILIRIEKTKLENEKEKNTHQQKLSEKSIYINAYFEKYSTMYQEIQNVSASINMFTYWREKLTPLYKDVEKNKKYTENDIDRYIKNQNNYERYELNFLYFYDVLTKDNFILQQSFFKNKILLDETEQELVAKIIYNTDKYCGLLSTFLESRTRMSLEDVSDEVYKDFFVRNESAIFKYSKNIEEAMLEIEKIFKEKFTNDID